MLGAMLMLIALLVLAAVLDSIPRQYRQMR